MAAETPAAPGCDAVTVNKMASTGVSQISQYSAAVHALQDLVTDKIDQLARCKPVLRSQLNAEITSYMAQLRADYRKLEEEAEELHRLACSPIVCFDPAGLHRYL